jgi:hypothetical protein
MILNHFSTASPAERLAVGASNGWAMKISSGAMAMLMFAIPLAVVTSELSTTPTLQRHRPLSFSCKNF